MTNGTLRTREPLFGKTLNSFIDAVFVVDSETMKIVECNEGASEIFGYTHEEMVWHDIVLLHVDEESRRELRTDLLSIIQKDGFVHLYKFRMKRKDGTIFPTEHSLRYFNNEQGDRFFIYVIRDITEREKTKEALVKSEEKFSKAFHASPVVVAISTAKGGHFLEFNEEWEKFTGYNRHEMIGKSAETFRLWENARDRKDILRLLDTAKRIRNREYCFRTRTGNVVTGIVSAETIDLAGEPCILWVIVDISERKELENALNKKEKELREYASNLEDTNTALRVLLNRREDEKRAFEDEIMANLEELVLPYIGKLKDGRLDSEHVAAVNMLEANLHGIFSPFLRKLTTVFSNLTPTEIEVANLIKEGKTSKYIAGILNVSKRTVDAHRNNIRDKLGLRNKKLNLQNYLNNIQNY